MVDVAQCEAVEHLNHLLAARTAAYGTDIVDSRPAHLVTSQMPLAAMTSRKKRAHRLPHNSDCAAQPDKWLLAGCGHVLWQQAGTTPAPLITTEHRTF